MVDLLTPALIGLWGWLFVEHLVQDGHVFAFLRDARPAAYRVEGFRGLYHQYTTCGVCHAGFLATCYAAFVTVLNVTIDYDDTAIWQITTALGTLFTNLFVSATISMSVARVMTIKY